MVYVPQTVVRGSLVVLGDLPGGLWWFARWSTGGFEKKSIAKIVSDA
jgi:hypothetical protein